MKNFLVWRDIEEKESADKFYELDAWEASRSWAKKNLFTDGDIARVWVAWVKAGAVPALFNVRLDLVPDYSSDEVEPIGEIK